MPAAARHQDPIGHSPTMSWLMKGLIAGAIAGAALAVASVLIVGTGGLAAVAIVGGMAAAGAGVGELTSTMSFAEKEVCGALTAAAFNVFTNGLAAARAHVDFGQCSKHPSPDALVATGSASVFINGLPAARVDDKTICSAVITKGSANVFIGGGTVQTDTINPENLVPGWVHAALFVVGAGAAVVLAGPVLAAVGLVGGIAGGIGGGWLGGMVFGEGSDGQKWSMLGGSVLGGFLGTKGGARIWPKSAIPPAKLQLQQGQLRNAIAAEYSRLLGTGISPKKLGPALAGAMDMKTGKIYFGTNATGNKIPNVLAPGLRARLEGMPPEVLQGYIKTHGAGTHAEIYALNDAMLARPGAKPSEFLLYVVNAGGKAPTRGLPIPRCPHCQYLTEGTNYFPGDLTYGR